MDSTPQKSRLRRWGTVAAALVVLVAVGPATASLTWIFRQR